MLNNLLKKNVSLNSLHKTLLREFAAVHNRLNEGFYETNLKLINTIDHLQDVIKALVEPTIKGPKLSIETDYPLAIHSNDFKFPWGSSRDNTRHPRFVQACASYFDIQKLKYLDLGCAGGGLVLDFLIDGHIAYGIDGSDFPIKNQFGCWKVIPNNLFTADLAKPFKLVDSTTQVAKFNVISAWEVLEHIPEDSLDTFLENVTLHLEEGGIFLGSICCISDMVDGHEYHATVQPKEWWHKKFSDHGFKFVENKFTIKDFPRGSLNPRTRDYDCTLNPNNHFNVVVTLKS